MTDDNNKRREVLQMLGAASVGVAMSTSNVSASSSSDTDVNEAGRQTLDGTDIPKPSARKLGYNIKILNNDSSAHSVTITIKRRTPGETNPTVYSEQFGVDAEPEGKNPDRRPNIMGGPSELPLGTPGEFKVVASLDDGRTDETAWSVPRMPVPRNKGLRVRIKEDRFTLREVTV